ncbi:MAG: adenine deaminase [Syntrophobacterales bacterium]|nr:adenine deaminase [Syntrophobacterales bacterium]
MKTSYERWRQFIRVARGLEKAQLCFRNIRLVNVLTGQIEETDLAVHDGIVVGCGEYDGYENIDCRGSYVSPGFIEGHIHIESSLLIPERFAEAVVPWGTTTVIADPHEIANVCGIEGISYILEASREVSHLVDIFVMLPSCVPASFLETSGAKLNAVDLFTLKNHERVLGLGELMNFPGILEADRSIWEKIFLFGDHPIDGHSPLLTGKDLNAYVLSGVRSDHESTNLEEAKEKLSRGMWVMIREGSQSKDLETLIGLVDDNTWHRCLWVSDDRHPDDLFRKGHLNVQVNRAMDLGLSPFRSIALATFTPSIAYGLRDRGILAPGALADFSISPSLKPWVAKRVFKGGREVARNGKLIESCQGRAPKPISPMKIAEVNPSHFAVRAKGTLIRVIGIKEHSILTESLVEVAKVENGMVVSDPDRDILKIAVWNRYESGVLPAVGFCKGLGLKEGAIASTVAHDNHNLIVAGVSDESMTVAVETLRETGGGLVVVDAKGSRVVLPLEVGGLMTDSSVETVTRRLEEIKDKTRSLGSSLENPFMALSFVALAVIPSLKLTDRGLVDVERFAFVPLFVD